VAHPLHQLTEIRACFGGELVAGVPKVVNMDALQADSGQRGQPHPPGEVAVTQRRALRTGEDEDRLRAFILLLVEGWMETARAAEGRLAWNDAISIVSAVAECGSRDPARHNAHLWHMHLLAQSGRLEELAERAESDRHARRQLDRTLYETGRGDDLRRRAEHGDEYALYLLVRLLGE
jgi:hypothetical protein